MAGSLCHIIAEDGSFQPELCENLGDCYEALSEFHQFIAVLANRFGGDLIVRGIMKECAFPVPDVMPKIDPSLHGVNSKWKGSV